jgi:cation diffusion facilitator CzcD-associated flavoprotein CzcO
MNEAPGCKRFIVDRGYLDSLSKPNVTLKWDTIERIEDSGIRLKTGELVELDIIIFATGFKTV